jgi:hypothetical protein
VAAVSAQSDYGVAVVEALIRPALAGTGVFDENEPETAAGDVIAYLLHWVEAQYPQTDEDDDEGEILAGHALAMAENHWQAERGDGDDIAQGSEDHYRELTAALATREVVPTVQRAAEVIARSLPSLRPSDKDGPAAHSLRIANYLAAAGLLTAATEPDPNHHRRNK